MKLIKTLIAASLGLTAPLPHCEASTEPVINITRKAEQTPANIIVHSRYDFEQPLSLKINNDPRFTVNDALIKTISALKITDQVGVRITDDFAIDPNQKLVIGYSHGSAEIIKTTKVPDGVRIVASFKDKQGAFVSPDKEKMAVTDLQGQKLCFDNQAISEDPEQLHVQLYLDRSSSMGEHLPTVKRAATQFLQLMPAHAVCSVALFNQSWWFTDAYYQNCRAHDFGLNAFQAKGSTNFYPMIKASYEHFAMPELADSQKAIVLITDGASAEDDVLRDQILALKDDVLTLVYFIGDVDRHILEPFADHFVMHQDNVESTLGEYFKTINSAFNTQQVLTVTACEGDL